MDRLKRGDLVETGCIVADSARIGLNVTIRAGSVIEDNAVIHDNVYIDYNVVVREGAEIGKNSYIGAGCIIGEYAADFFEERVPRSRTLRIGENAVIRSGSIIYEGSVIGSHFQTGHHVTVREQSEIGEHVSAGTLVDIQGFCRIGSYVRMHSNVHVGQKSLIEDFVWLFPYALLINDPTPPSNELDGVTLKSFSVIAARSVVLPGILVEGDSLVAAGAVVTKDVHAGEVVGGNPAKVISDISRIRNRTTGEKVYPWRYTFKRGMPWQESDYDTWYRGIAEQLE